MQVGVEVLPRAVDPLVDDRPRPPAGCGSARTGRRTPAARRSRTRPVSCRRDEVGPRPPGSPTAPGPRRSGRRRSRAAGCAGRPEPALRGPLDRAVRRLRTGRSSATASCCAARRAASSASASGSSRSSGAPVSTWLPADDVQLAHLGGERRVQHRLHLHALQHEHGGVGLDLRADRDGSRDHQGRCGRAHDAALVAADAVRDAVDLDEVHRAVRRPSRAGTACRRW